MAWVAMTSERERLPKTPLGWGGVSVALLQLGLPCVAIHKVVCWAHMPIRLCDLPDELLVIMAFRLNLKEASRFWATWTRADAIPWEEVHRLPND